MKKFLSVLITVLICLIMSSCGNQSKPKTPTEATRYEYGSDGFYIVKECYDRKGNLFEEYYYTFDTEIYSLECTIKAYNTFDENGNLLKSEGHYVSNPYHAMRENVLMIESVQHERFDYKIVNEDGNIELYIKQTKNEKGQIKREEYYTAGGRFIRVEEVDYREDGTVSARRGKNARDELIYESLCNEKGNFVSSTQYDETGRKTAIFSAEYYESGVMRAYKETTVYKDGSMGDAATVAEFDESGRPTKYGNKSYYYNQNGSFYVTSYLFGLEHYNFNAEGYLMSYQNSSNDMDIHYTYDEQGRLSSAVTKDDSSGRILANVSYLYREDHSVVVRIEKATSANDQVIYTDTKGRIIKSEDYRGASLLSYETIEYDAYGNVTRMCEYKNDKLNKEYLYEYNEHGDLMKEEIRSYYSSSVGKKFTEYEYFENGYVKSVVAYNNENTLRNTSYTKEYDADGGYVYTEYFLGQMSRRFTYDRYGEVIKSESFDVSLG